jgi:hypothetical protein
LFTSEEAAAVWMNSHDGTFTISVEDAFHVGRLANRARFGRALAGGSTTT